jgi:hypothetical protein
MLPIQAPRVPIQVLVGASSTASETTFTSFPVLRAADRLVSLIVEALLIILSEIGNNQLL